MGVLLLLGSYFLLGLYSLPSTAKTYDEGIHLIGGYTFWTEQDFRLHPQNGNLPQRWASLPMLFLETPAFPLEASSWRLPDGWYAEEYYLYQMQTEPLWILFCGRVMMLLMTTAMGLLIYVYAKRLFGVAGGFIALTVFAFNPEMLAHGRLVTSDMMGAAMYLLSLWGLGRLLETLTIGRVLMLGVAVGSLTVSKNHAALFAPVAVVSLIATSVGWREYSVRWGRRSWQLTGFWRVFAARFAVLAVAAVLAVGVLWSYYGFRYEAFNPELPAPERNWDWDWALGDGSGAVKVVSSLREARLLPEAYLFGVAHILRGGEQRHAFLLGEYAYKGWWVYFPIALLLKSPVALIVLASAAIICYLIYIKRRRRGLWGDEALAAKLLLGLPLIFFIAIYSLVASNSAFNIGLRYLMPVIVCGIVLLGSLAYWWRKSRLGRIVISALLGLYALESTLVFPRYLSFFNVAVGGPQNGYNLLVDSSLDWGQDLNALADWLAEHNPEPNAEPVYLGYFGAESPRYAGIDARYLTSMGAHHNESYHLGILEPGYYALSATMLQGISYNIERPWSERQAKAYVKAHQAISELDTSSNNAQALFQYVMHHDPKHWMDVMNSYEVLRAESLRMYILGMQPVTRINDTIFVYHLTQADLDAAVLDPSFGFAADFPYAVWKEQIKIALKGQRVRLDKP